METPEFVDLSRPPRRALVVVAHPDDIDFGMSGTVAALTEVGTEVVYPDARNPHAHARLLAEGLEPHTVPEVWIGGLEPPDLFVDITDVFDRKVAALSSHESQVAWIDGIDGFLRNWASETTAHYGLPEGRLTEAFRRVNTA